VRTWTIEALGTHQPIFTLTGHPDLGGSRSWSVRIGNKTYRAIWIPGHGLCADEPPWGDATTFSEMCPFLAAQQPDGSYPCGLVGTSWEPIYTTTCAPMGELWTESSVAEWQANHPLCSYYWVPA
jgi:hypothetical protein